METAESAVDQTTANPEQVATVAPETPAASAENPNLGNAADFTVDLNAFVPQAPTSSGNGHDAAQAEVKRPRGRPEK